MKDLSNENVVHIKNKDCEYLQFRRLLEYNNILKHAYGLKPANYKAYGDGVTSEIIANVEKKYEILCNSIGVDYNKLVVPDQEHTDVVKNVENVGFKVSLRGEDFLKTDGLVTNKKGIVLGTINADCILMIFFDPVKRVIANVHSGWKGTFQKIAVNGVNKMVQEYGSNPEDIICCICPSIRKCHFEVEKDVKDMCENIFSYTGQIENIIEYVGKKDGKDKWRIDTVLINRIILQDLGLKNENIVDSGICSVCNSELIHSYRAEGKGYNLRNTAVVSIVNMV